MSLRNVVRTFGGELRRDGLSASIPAPGHSRRDRSISLTLAGDRLLIHSFGGAGWREAAAELRAVGFIDGRGRWIAGGGVTEPRPPGQAGLDRVALARSLWEASGPVAASDPAAAYLRRRGVSAALWGSGALRAMRRCPLSVTRPDGAHRPALLAAVSLEDRFTAVEITYLRPWGERDRSLRLSRKCVGRLPPGCAVALSAPAPAMVVGEGVVTVLSAMAVFGRPGQALLSAANVPRWVPPGVVRDVLVAADRDRAGAAAALALAARLRTRGIACRIAWPPAGCGDWNDALLGSGGEEEGRPGAPAAGDGLRAPVGDRS